MSCFAQGSRTRLSYDVESTYGTNPAGNFTPIPFNTHSLNLSKDRVTGNEIRADRIPRVDRHGNKQTAGEIVLDLRKGNDGGTTPANYAIDDFIESVMFNTWDTSNQISPGTTEKSFTIEDASLDIDQYRLFTGMVVNTWGVSIAPNQMVTSTFGFVGSNMTISGTGQTQVSDTTYEPFDGYSGNIFLQDQGTTDTSIATVTSVDFTLDNGLEPNFILGSDGVQCFTSGRATVEGTITAFFEDASLINRFINETASELKLTVDDPTGSNPYTFNFPRIKVNSADTGVDGPGQRLITLSFVALYDDTEGTNFIVTRTA